MEKKLQRRVVLKKKDIPAANIDQDALPHDILPQHTVLRDSKTHRMWITRANRLKSQ